jgi:hypothetical protein
MSLSVEAVWCAFNARYFVDEVGIGRLKNNLWIDAGVGTFADQFTLLWSREENTLDVANANSFSGGLFNGSSCS